MGVPVVISTNGFGRPVKVVEKNAPVLEVSPNGFGIPIVLSDLGRRLSFKAAVPARSRTIGRPTRPSMSATTQLRLVQSRR